TINKSSLDTVYYLYELGGEGSCKQIEIRHGNSAQHYNANAIYVAKCVYGGQFEFGSRKFRVVRGVEQSV
ncbi:MAG: hypothetical protein J6X43_00930, partial [Bacteroidales bacterium]|nr:hypothetical protein [Bacteroidales bacterium]